MNWLRAWGCGLANSSNWPNERQPVSYPQFLDTPAKHRSLLAELIWFSGSGESRVRFALSLATPVVSNGL